VSDVISQAAATTGLHEPILEASDATIARGRPCFAAAPMATAGRHCSAPLRACSSA
jgi:hypothetical protein